EDAGGGEEEGGGDEADDEAGGGEVAGGGGHAPGGIGGAADGQAGEEAEGEEEGRGLVAEAPGGGEQGHAGPLTPALSKLAISRSMAAAARTSGQARRAPVPSPRRMPRSSSGVAPSAASTA